MSNGFLLFDIGNTTMKIGIADATGLQDSYTLPCGNRETGDSLGLALLSSLQNAGRSAKDVEACVISSVNPAMDEPLVFAARRYFGCRALFAGRDLHVPLANNYPHPAEVGADILVGAYEARKLYPEPASLIVADFGTAATFACVEGNAFSGGLIFPGPNTAMQSLALHAANLPLIRLDDPGPEPDFCKDTITSIQHGLLFGYGAMTEGLCARIRQKLKPPVFIVATGGFAMLVSKLGNIFDAIVPTLVLDGLHRMYMDSLQSQQ